MTRPRLVLRGLMFHWRGNLAVCLGVVVGTAVLTGALLVGDSLRGSLGDLTLRRLGWIDRALVGSRFLRESVADSLPAERVSPAVVLRGTAGTEGDQLQVRRVNVLGVDHRFWPRGDDTGFWDGAGPGVVLNRALAEDLGVSAGRAVTLRVQKASDVPRESLLGRRDSSAVVDEITLPVHAVLGEDEFGNRFSLQPTADVPRNAYVPLRVLQEKLGQPGRVNALFVGGAGPGLQEEFKNRLTLDDWGLVLRTPRGRADALFARYDRDGNGTLEPREWRGRLAESLVAAVDPRKGPLSREAVEAYYRRERNYLSLESRNLLLDAAAESAALAAAKDAGLRAAPTLVYLANTIAAGGREIPYSVVAALDPAQAPPLGPFLPPGVKELADDQIVLADWKDSPITAPEGTTVRLSYFGPEQHGGGQLLTSDFRLAGRIPLRGPAADPDLTPEFPGVTDRADVRGWNPPPPFDNEDITRRIKPNDANEQYWRDYRTTPKAYVTLAAGQRMWGSRFGRLTSVRLAAPDGADPEAAADAYRRSLLKHLDPEQAGLVFDDVKGEALEASKGGGFGFDELLLGFSSFLILAALLLVGLLFRLNLDRRAAEVGLLLAAGYRRRTVRGLLLAEGAALAVVGALLGCVAATAYARLLLRFLAAVWPGGALQSFLEFHYTWASLAYGFGASLLVSLLTIAWAVRVLGRVAPAALLAGQTTGEGEPGARAPARWPWWVAAVALVGALVLVAAGGRVRDPEAQAGTFFGGGMLLLAACLLAVWGWMRGSGRRAVTGHGPWGVARLGVRNAARHPVRSLLTAGLLASAAFLVVAVEAFRRQADAAEAGGGFALLAESDLPVFADLNSERGRGELADRLRQRYQDEGLAAADVQRRVDEASDLLRQTKVYAFRVRAGDDASCLNLYEPRRPRLLGVPAGLIEHGGFQFTETEGRSPEEKKNPWLILERQGGDAVPAFGENNTVVWMLKKQLGGIQAVPTARGTLASLRIDGLLRDSVFQSGLLLSEVHFLRLYPGQDGYNFFLIQAPPGREAEVKAVLEQALADRGFEVTPAARRLEAYLAVENTYLSTFQALGGLGLVLGSLGLAVVLLRGVWERRGELALFRALGFRRAALGWLVLAENGFLLLLGLGAGTVSALLAVAPHLAGGAGAVPWRELLALLTGALAVGLLAGLAAVATTLRAPLVPALRRE
jgi:ABC-type antimicrobial peptide transport system permease subunit